MKKLILVLFIALMCSAPIINATNYSDGVFFINEDWYGHSNGSVNFLSSDGTWHYRVFQVENPGHELGATTQFGTIYGDRLYIVSKQDKDPSATIQGSRLAVCDAATMKVLKEFPNIGGADGRSFLGVDDRKGYIGTSNGIKVYDISNMVIGSTIEGTGNTSGGLYTNQIGNMIRVGNRVFAIHQQKGVIVINPDTDIVETIIPGFYGSIVLSKDGNLWLSVAKDSNGAGNTLDKIIKINPYTLDTTTYDLPAKMGIPNSWYAWTVDGFCASVQENKLYWKNNGGWFASKYIYCYDIESNSITRVADFGEWEIYGAGFRIDPVTDEIFCTINNGGMQSQQYKVVRINTKTATTVDYPMIENYWFPAMPVFPDNFAPIISNDLVDMKISEKAIITLTDKVTDKDNLQSAIIPSISSIADDGVIIAEIVDNTLVVTPICENGNTIITLKFNSNGKTVIKDIVVTVDNFLSVDDNITNKVSVYPNPATDYITVDAQQDARIQLSSINGSVIYDSVATDATTTISLESLQPGIYILNVNNHITKIIKK